MFELINDYAERNIMLHRSMESLYEALREFIVAQDSDNKIIGCVALDIFWANLAEIKSLAVAPEARGKGIGRQLVQADPDVPSTFDSCPRMAIMKIITHRNYETLNPLQFTGSALCLSCPDFLKELIKIAF